MSDDIKALRKRAMYDPQSLTSQEWSQIHKAAFSVPKKDFSDDNYQFGSEAEEERMVVKNYGR